jgi:hypothetical protein
MSPTNMYSRNETHEKLGGTWDIQMVSEMSHDQVTQFMHSEM